MANWKEYTTKAIPEDTDEIVIADAKANANKRTPLSGLWNWIAGKLATAVISQLETQNKSIIPALNELNSNPHFVNICTADKGKTIVITPTQKGFTYHFSAFCYGDSNGRYFTALLSETSQKADGCSISKVDGNYEIFLGAWSYLNIVSSQKFTYSIK